MSSPTQTAVRLGSTSVLAYLALVRPPFVLIAAFSWRTVADTGQRNLFGVANLGVNVVANASFLADDGEVDRVVTTIPRSSEFRTLHG